MTQTSPSAHRLLKLIIFALIVPWCGCKSASAPTPENFTRGHQQVSDGPPGLPLQNSAPLPLRNLRPWGNQATRYARSKQVIEQGDGACNSHNPLHRLRLWSKSRRLASVTAFVTSPGSNPLRHLPRPSTASTSPKVTYRYALEDVPVWAKDADVQKAYPALATSISDPPPATITLAQTGVGWQVPD